MGYTGNVFIEYQHWGLLWNTCRGSGNLMKFRKSDSFPKLQWCIKEELHFDWEEIRQRKDEHWINWHSDF